VEDAGTWDSKKVHDFIYNMLGVLRYVHDQDILHRDLKVKRVRF